MREIKFRAWIGDRMEYSVVAGLGNGYFINEKAECVTKYENCPIMQYSDIKDKNGKDIYEGDVLQYDRDGMTKIGAIRGPVIFSQGRFRFGEGLTSAYALTPSFGRFHKVIGNIYENPELLTQTN